MSAEREIPSTGRRSSRLPYLVALVLMGTFVVLAWMGQHRLEPVIVGHAAPNFTVTDLKGDTVQLADFRGRVVLLNVWATWCPPCVEEMPSMERLYQEIRGEEGGEDFEILAVSVDAAIERPDARGGVTRGDLADFASGLELTYPIVHDPPGRIQNLYQTTGVPESFVVGRDGVIYLKIAGPTDWDAPQYVDLIRRLLEST